MKIVLFAAVVVAILLVTTFALWRRGAKKGLYDRHPLLLTAAERSFYGVLMAAVESRYFVAPKVPVTDVLRPKLRLSKNVAKVARVAVSKKRFDFVLCHPETFAIVAAVELDDVSHVQGKRQAHDQFLDDSAKGAELPLFRFSVQPKYELAAVREGLAELLGAGSVDASPTASMHVRKGPPKPGASPPRGRRPAPAKPVAPATPATPRRPAPLPERD